ncbi:hypothetical protein HOD29_04660 [archaeon]|jgi:hypothetical protein|nr:hypothetical protein [archaeon]
MKSLLLKLKPGKQKEEAIDVIRDILFDHSTQGSYTLISRNIIFEAP